MRIKSLTSFPTVYRAPSESKKIESSPDRVELSPRLDKPVVPAPVAQAVVAATTGPVGPVVADELSKLDCQFFHHKRFHWPWTDAYQPLTPEQAAEALNEGSSRLRVEVDGQKCRLGNLDELAVLEQALTGATQRPLTSQASAMVGHALLDPVSGKTTSLYEAFLKLEGNGPIVAFEEGYPLVRLEQDKPVETRDLSAFKAALQASPAEGAAMLVEALGADLGEIEPARLYPLSSPHRRVIEAMHDKLSPEQIAARLRLLGDQPKDAALALEQIGLYQPDADLGLLTKARQALKQIDDDPKAFASLKKLVGQNPAAFYAAFSDDPVEACLQAVPNESGKVRELFATAELKTAVAATIQLVELASLSQCLDRGRGSLAERLQALSTASKGFKPELFYDLHMNLVASGNSQAEAAQTIAGLIAALDQQRARNAYDFENRVAMPAVALIEAQLSAPERAPTRALYLEQLNGGRPVDVTKLFEPAGSTNLEQRTELMRALRQQPMPDRLYELASGELAQGRSLEQARERTLEFAAAAEKTRVYPEDSYHWQYTLEKPYNFYQAELLKPGREPARQLFLEMLSQQQHALSIEHLLPEVTGLGLQQ
ncbi:MAG: hypothetical protein KC910_25765, partial [Candidatus Eremiobacteraeota bacterium]|nr:hypothetical protein [Candidatus Eremiobacteraeota bacterium]